MNDKRMRGQMLLVNVLDILAVILSALLGDYVRHGTFGFKGIMLPQSTIYL